MQNPTQKCDAQLLFARNMRRIRLGLELTQERLAERAELHPNYISSVERGERNISIRNIERIAKALRVAMSELVSQPENTAETKPASNEAEQASLIHIGYTQPDAGEPKAP